MRDTDRQFLHLTLKPIAEMVSEELAEKLGVPGLEFHFEDLSAADVVGRSKAFATLKEAGVDAEEAKRLSGLV